MSGIIENNRLKILNPVTKKEIANYTISSEKDITRVISDAQVDSVWRNLPLSKRCSVINQLRKSIAKNKDEIHQTLKNETGKSDLDIVIEIFTTLDHLKQISKIANKVLKDSYRGTGLMKTKKAYVSFEPLGVAGVISPWNYPLATPITSAVEALLAGNSVVLKPSEHTPMTSVLIKKIWDENIEYKKSFQILIGDGKVGQTIIESNDIDIVCFTGSTAIGKKIALECSKTLKPHVLELGGKDPMIILNDANVHRSVESALFGGLSNAGQTCISTEEVFIEDGIYDTFLSKITKRVKSIKSGTGTDSDLGSMIMPQNTEKVNHHISEAGKTCQIIQGSNDSGEMFIPPTIVIEPDHELSIVKEETFGPVLSLRKFSDDKDLMNKIHKTGYGLSASIFGKNNKRIQKIVKNLKTGNVSVNDVLTHYGIASLPFGGEGYSGVGRMHGEEGLKSLCRIKSVVINRFNFIDELWWFGKSNKIEKILNNIIKVLYK